ncbi:hypothetical protein NFI95_10325 [Acetobacteraceae bacterium KSS8]|uniref:SMI1/KNR4 family protein n=1 Tax=Endosaccharibacter trunci TaxID=2812733 RepID=A0ABT1W7I9_9PROT|nr:hypothetical protein [Acetobacteraceae bacterium KSS8]
MTMQKTPLEIAIRSRDLLLPVIRRHGRLVDGARQDGSLRFLVLERPPWRFRHWTPFNALGREEPSSPGYRHALERQRGKDDLPYGFDIHIGDRLVVCLLWSDSGEADLVQFEAGPWQSQLSRYDAFLQPWDGDCGA